MCAHLPGHSATFGGRMAKSKVERVLHEFKTGTLRSSDGRLVTQRDQAIAIALAESEKARKRRGGR